MIEWPQFDPFAVHFTETTGVTWYGITYLAGFVASWLLARQRAQTAHSPLKVAEVDDLIFYGAMGVLLGGRLGYMLFYASGAVLDNPLSIFQVWKGGMSFHGGLIGVLCAIGLYARKLKLPFWVLGDFVTPLVPLGLCFGRIGNFINGELWGKVTDVPWAIVYNGLPRHPSQLYESALEGLVLFLMLWFYSAKPRPTMAISGLFLVGYGIFRILIEFVRVPDNGEYFALDWVTRGQVLSVPMVLAGVLMMIWAYRRGQIFTAKEPQA
jgi:phosphatidylglycerol:prolipoprotein diacylglycerol transferase